MFTNVNAILDQIKANIEKEITSIPVFIEEPISLVYTDLPAIYIYPFKEDYFEDRTTQNELCKRLQLRIELRMTGTPANSICSPIMNQISSTFGNDLTLNGLVFYVELQTLQWANDNTSSGPVCGMSLDVQIDYFVENS